MHINELVAKATSQAILSGFTHHDKPRSVAEHTALIITEVGELYEAHRDGYAPGNHLFQHRGGVVNSQPYDDEFASGKPVGIPSELADIVIRVANMAGEYGIDLERAIDEKMEYNAGRPRMHGRKA